MTVRGNGREPNGALGGVRLTLAPQQSVATQLAFQLGECFHNGGAGWILMRSSRRALPILGPRFRDALGRAFYLAVGEAAEPQALTSAARTLHEHALSDCPERAVHVRVGAAEDLVYVDLADGTGCAAELSHAGWRTVSAPPICFHCPSNMLPLPRPVPGGDLHEFERFFNVGDRSDLVMLIAFLLAALRPRGPYPVLLLEGPPGSAKSTATTMVKSLIDPTNPRTRSLPRDDRDAFIAAKANHVLAFDNVSAVSPSMSDTLCRLATGGGFATRKLRTDADEMIVEAQRPIVLNGIDGVARRGDLLDRAITITLDTIPDNRRQPESILRAEFERARPRLLGALLDAVTIGLGRIDGVIAELDSAPRMADFYAWALACEPAFAQLGAFAPAFEANRRAALSRDVEQNQEVRALLDALGDEIVEWRGTASELLFIVNPNRRQGLPTTPNKLSQALFVAAPILQRAGWSVTRERSGSRANERILVLRRLALTPAP